jgi:hypothetical protein
MNDDDTGDTLPIGPVVAAAGALLLIVSLFLNWYEGDLEAFTVFEFLDLLLVLLALATIASLAGGLGLIRPAPSPAVSLAVALFTIFVVGSQVVNDPPLVAGVGGPGKDLGIWLALAGSALMVAGSILAFARISLAVEARPSRRAAADADPTRPLSDPETPAPGREGERP